MIEQEAKKAKDALRERLKAEMDAIGADRVKAEALAKLAQLKKHWSKA